MTDQKIIIAAADYSVGRSNRGILSIAFADGVKWHRDNDQTMKKVRELRDQYVEYVDLTKEYSAYEWCMLSPNKKWKIKSEMKMMKVFIQELNNIIDEP